MKTYIETSKPGHFIKVWSGYEIGGMSYFTGTVTPRAYTLCARLIEREVHEGYTTESFLVFGHGLKKTLLEVKRQSAKAAAQAEVLAEQYKEQLVEAVLAQAGLTRKVA